MALKDIGQAAPDRMAVSEWLNTVMLNEVAHKSLITLGQYLLGTSAVTGVQRFKFGDDVPYKIKSGIIAGINVANDYLSTPVGGSVRNGAVFQAANRLLETMQDPNIEGIPIHATQEMEVTEVEVSKNVVIDTVASNKTEVVDNAVPALRQWTLRGHLVANARLSELDNHLIIKPGLVAQKAILQLFADSRRPVMYKTHDNRFFRVLISHFSSGYNTSYLNGLDVELTLTEFRTLNISGDSMEMTIMDKIGEAA